MSLAARHEAGRPWLTPFKTNISDVEYQVTEKGRAASVDNALGLKAKGK